MNIYHSHRNNFRYIVAGGGTGGVTVFMGEQLNHTNAEVLYLDFSDRAMNIAQRRAKVRRLQNIIWVRGWIEEVTYGGVGLFDKLQSSGVLHHLKKPLIGLLKLKDILTARGGLSLMVYAMYGRTGVYATQRLCNMAISQYGQVNIELEKANNILKILPGSNWLVKNNHMIKYDDADTYDMFLHKRDVSFSFLNMIRWIETEGGLHFVYCSNTKISNILMEYRIGERKLEAGLYHLDPKQLVAFAELFSGDVIKHDFYASKVENSMANVHESSNFMYLYGNPLDLKSAISNEKNRKLHDNQMFFNAWKYDVYSHTTLMRDIDLGNFPRSIVRLELNNFNRFLLNKLLHSENEIVLKDIFNSYSKYDKTLNYTLSKRKIAILLHVFFTSVKDSQIFLLKKSSIKPFPKTSHAHLSVIRSIGNVRNDNI